MVKNKNISNTLKCSLYLSCLLITHSFALAPRSDAGVSLLPLPSDIPVIEPVEMPSKLDLSKAGTDDSAKSKIMTADLLVRQLTGLTYSGWIKKAYDLYVEASVIDGINADLRGRAKISAAELYPYSNTDDATYASIQQRKIESLKLFEDIIEDTTLSIDLRSVAKLSVAKLYLENTFDVDPIEAKQKALSLLQKVIAGDDKDLSVDVKARAKLLLAISYNKMLLDVSRADAQQKATSLFNEVKADTKVSIQHKAEAAFGLAYVKNSDDDPYNAQRLVALKAISTEATYSASIQAKAKVLMARGLLKGEFDSKPSEAGPMALSIYKEIVADPKPDASATTTAATTTSAGTTNAGKVNTKLDPAESFSYKLEFANNLANNAFHQKSAEAKAAAQDIYTKLLADVSVYTDQKVAVKWQLALHYFEKRLDPPAGKDARTAGTNLINEILTDSHVNFELFFLVKLNFARLHHYSFIKNPLGLPAGQEKNEALETLDDLLNDSRASGKQKEMVQSELNMWNGIVKR